MCCVPWIDHIASNHMYFSHISRALGEWCASCVCGRFAAACNPGPPGLKPRSLLAGLEQPSLGTIPRRTSLIRGIYLMSAAGLPEQLISVENNCASDESRSSLSCPIDTFASQLLDLGRHSAVI